MKGSYQSSSHFAHRQFPVDSGKIPVKVKRGFPKEVVAAIRDGKILGIRAGTKPHRVIGIWAVVVENRVFVRSWGS